jgi:cation-transporting ATPase 13A1
MTKLTRARTTLYPDHAALQEDEPNLVNSVCFLVNWIVQLTTFGVNYIGHPFNTSLQDNKGLATCLR